MTKVTFEEKLTKMLAIDVLPRADSEYVICESDYATWQCYKSQSLTKVNVFSCYKSYGNEMETTYKSVFCRKIILPSSKLIIG